MKIAELVNKHYADLSENDLLIWDYIRKHQKQCGSLSITELAACCHVSRSTIMRFAQKLGLRGYTELKVYLRMEGECGGSIKTGLDIVYDTYSRYMKKLKEQDMSRVIEKISQSENLYVYGTGVVQNNLASELKRYFLEVDQLFTVISGKDEAHICEEIIARGDMVVIISYSGENKFAVAFAQRLKMRGVFVVSITFSSENELSHLADESFYIDTPKVMQSLRSPHEGLVGYFLLIDFLVTKYIDHYEGKRKQSNEADGSD